MTLSAKVAGLDALKRRLADAAGGAGLAAALDGAGEDLRASAAAELQRAAPADAGDRLADGLASAGGGRATAVQVSTADPLARALEFGGLRIAPRPWAEAALAAARPRILARFARWLQSTLKT